MTGKPNPVAAFFGWLLIAAGVLIATTAGACSAFFIISMTATGNDIGAWISFLGLVLVLGGIPVGLGVGLFFIGRMLTRGRVTRRD